MEKCTRIVWRFFVAWFACAVFVLSCDNPFLPNTGEPLKANTGRQTPEGVVLQLFHSYETRQINLFTDLFSPAKDFRFYISKSFQPYYLSAHGGGNLENIDSSFAYVYKRISDENAYYWTYNDEIQIHNNLFSMAVEIRMQQNPQLIDSGSVRYFIGPNGTEYAEVVVLDGQMQITTQTPSDQVVEDYFVDIGSQVFYLERDPQNATLWVIAKWFDLSTASSL